jgi:VanZ family protein
VSGAGADAPPLAVSGAAPPAARSAVVPRRPAITARVWAGILGLLAGAALVTVITLHPAPVDRGHRALVREALALLHGLGVPEWFGYAALEFTANIMMFVPLGFFAALLLPLGRAWLAALLGAGFSAAVEIAQLALLPERFASVPDVVANTTGTGVGVGLAVLLRVCVAARDRRLLREAGIPAAAPAAPPTPAPSRSN